MTDTVPEDLVAVAVPQLLRSRLAYEGFVRVWLDEVRLPSGREAKREVVEHPGAVGILALTEAGEVLLVRQWRHAAGRALLEIPAGTREAGESVAATARRELIEEVGFEPGALTDLLTFFPSPGYSSEQITLVRADGCRPVDHVPDPDEGTMLVTVPRGEIGRLIAWPNGPIQDGKTLVALLTLLAAERP